MKKIYLLILSTLFCSSFLLAQNYELVWEDTFEDSSLNTDYWNYETSEGIWNTGANQELQHYRSENVEVGLDDEDNEALIITAKEEEYEGYQFTSGRINTRGKVAAKYGRIEARIKLPEVADGLWPAFWTLGVENSWPACGEIDILEAGHAEGIANGQQERTFNGALHWDYQGTHAMHSDNALTPEDVSLYEYNTFALEWTPDRIEMFLNDSEEPYFAMDITGDDAEEFRSWPHYLILNLAVGGSFPGITNPNDITTPLPAKMYVDYVRIYQREGEGQLQITAPIDPPEEDYFGIFTENPSIDDKLQIDDMVSSVQIWENTLYPLDNAPSYDGDEVLAFYAPANRTWFGFGINTLNGIDMSHFSNGYLNFALRTDDDVDFYVGVGGADDAEGTVNFNYGDNSYGFTRDGTWQEVSIPLSDLIDDGLDISRVENLFMLGSSSGSITNILVDDIYYSVSGEGVENPNLNTDRDDAIEMPDNSIVADYYGVFTENPNISQYLSIDDVTGHIYIWENTLQFIDSDPYDGYEVISYTSVDGPGWWGFGIHNDEAHDLTHFENGTIAFSVKTTSQEDFNIEIHGAGESVGIIPFNYGDDPYGLIRDGEWHRIVVPLNDVDIDLSAVGIPFAASGSSVSAIAFDDIIYTVDANQPDNPAVGVSNGNGNDDDNGSSGVIDSDYYGVFTEDHFISQKFEIDDATGHIYLWNNLEEMTDVTPYEGDEVLAYSSPDDGWSGFGIASSEGVDLSHFVDGYLNFAIKIPTEFNDNFSVLMSDFSSNEAIIEFSAGSDPYEVERDGEWHFVSVPLSDFVGGSFDLTNVENLFAASSGSPSKGYIFDHIYFSIDKSTNIDVTTMSSVDIFPNPANEYFNISVDNNISAIKVYSLSGQLIYRANYSQSNNVTVTSSNWEPGYYIVKVITENGERIVSKLSITP
ncbi:family 16 glycosylhydrolase [Marinilabiliaceae bacterium ANBcel2]|nr:family 16 glycosylhydrolase [Marinilabiliaceae bacterium ANBcel2]